MHTLAIALMMAAFQTPAPTPTPEAPKPQGLVLQSGDWSLKIYGFARADFFYDDSRPNNILLPAVIRSEEDAATVAAFPGIAFEKGEADFEISPRLTRFGFDIGGPNAASIGAKVSGKIEVDFYGATTSDSRAELRMRHAYVKLAWDDFSILAGQTADIIAPLFPAVNNDLVMWGAGNLGDRRPMLLLDYRPKVGEGTVTAQLEIGVTGANDNQNLDGSPGSAYLDGPASGIPTIQGRLAYKGAHFWLDKKTWELGAWGHFAKEHLDTQGTFTEDDFTSTAFGADLVLPLHDMFEIRGEAWQGKNVDDVRGGIFQGIATTGAPGETREIESAGGWVELVVKPVEGWTIHVGSSRDNPLNEFIPAPTAASTGTTGAQGNYVHYVGNRFPVGGGVVIGVDILNWTTKWAGSLEDGTDNRVNAFIQWNF